MIEASKISKHFGNFKAVDNVSFKVKRGEIVGFLGPNGAGKTTTMRILTGYYLPDTGNCTIGGFDLVDAISKIKNKIGYLPENAPLYNNMLVYDFLLYTAALRQIPCPIKRVKEVIGLAALEKVYRKDIYELSRGYRQRVCFAQAILHDPDILILDEPTSGLDPNQIIEIRKLIKELGKEKTIILSTHILPEVSAICDRVLIINEGKIVADDKTENIANLSIPGENVLDITIKGKRKDIEKEFKKIDQISSYNIIEKNKDWVSYRLSSSSEIDFGELMFNISVNNNWILRELHQHTISLEDVFIKLTSDTRKN